MNLGKHRAKFTLEVELENSFRQILSNGCFAEPVRDEKIYSSELKLKDSLSEEPFFHLLSVPIRK